MGDIRKLVIDVLKPHHPSILEYADEISSVEGIDGVTIRVLEMDEKTESLEIAIEGRNVNFKEIKDIIEKLGGSIHSVDLVSAGKKLVES